MALTLDARTKALLSLVVLASLVVVLALVPVRFSPSVGSPSQTPDEPESTAGEALSRSVAETSFEERERPRSRASETRRSVVDPRGVDQQGASLLVRLRWDDGSPAGGVGVRVLPEGNADSFLDERRGFSDASGEARFANLVASSVMVRLDRGMSTKSQMQLVGETLVSITLPSGATIEGRVTDRDGRPVESAAVWLFEGAPRHRGTRSGEPLARTEAGGEFTIQGVWRPCLVVATCPGHAPATGSIREPTAGTVVKLELKLKGPSASLRGRVIDEAGHGVPNARVLVAIDPAARWTAGEEPLPGTLLTTDGAGLFDASDLAPGSASLLVRRGGFAPWSELMELTSAGTSEVTVVLTRAVSLSGRVVDHEREPLDGVTVEARGFAECERSVAVTSSAGEFRLEDVPAGRILVFAGKRGHSGAKAVLTGDPGGELRWDPVLAVQPEVEKDPNEETRRRMEEAKRRMAAIRSGAITGQFRGVVLDAAGTAIGGASVHCWMAEPEQWSAKGTTTAGSGAFVAGPLPAGRYSLSVVTGDEPPFVREGLELGSNETKDIGVIRLAASGRLSVSVKGPDGPVLRAFGTIRLPSGDGVASLGEGEPLSRRLRPGSYELTIAARGLGSVTRRFEIRAGEDTRVEVVLERGIARQLVFPNAPEAWRETTELRLRVSDPSGGPVCALSMIAAANWPFFSSCSPCLAPGEYRIEIGRPGEDPLRGEFTIRDLVPSLRPIRITLR